MITALLSGCGGTRSGEAVLRWQRELEAAPGFSFTAEITAMGVEGGTSFSVTCRCREGVTEAELTAPELLRGVGFRTEAGSTEIVFDGVVLSLGGITREGLSPCGVLPLLTEALIRGRVLYTWREEGLPAAALECGDEQSVSVWFSEDMRPLRAEFTEEGRTLLFCTIENWAVEA